MTREKHCHHQLDKNSSGYCGTGIACPIGVAAVEG